MRHALPRQRCTVQHRRCQQPQRHVCRAIQPIDTQQKGTSYAVREATTPAELRAAGYLRAYCFYTYPADRSEYSARMHRRMKGDLEWESVTRKVNGTEPDYKAMRVVCLIATVVDDPNCQTAVQAAQEMDLSTKLPADVDAGQPAQIVVGSLDVNQGAVLPAEELVGRLPAEGQATRRAYMSNVCVANAARRQGVAAALMRQAELIAEHQGVEHMYVHVVHDNTAAQRLYGSMGYEQETEETEAFARSLRRPRRLLLHKQIS